MKYTPAPWTLRSRLKIGDGLIATVNPRFKIASTEGVDPEEDEGNARLMEKAPEMLAALKQVTFFLETLVNLTGRGHDLLPTIEAARALIDRIETPKGVHHGTQEIKD